MEMDYLSFLDKIITDAIKAAKISYKQPHNANKLAGALLGLEACRGLTTQQLSLLLVEAKANYEATAQLVIAEKIANIDPKSDENYWLTRCKYAEILWVCECVSAVLENEGHPVIVRASTRAFMKMALLLGGSNTKMF